MEVASELRIAVLSVGPAWRGSGGERTARSIWLEPMRVKGIFIAFGPEFHRLVGRAVPPLLACGGARQGFDPSGG